MSNVPGSAIKSPPLFRSGSHKSELLSSDDIIALNQSLLTAIVTDDYPTYDLLCKEDITCIEPESQGSIIEGKAFHKFYFDLPQNREWGKPYVDTKVTMSNVQLRRIGKDVAILSYVRIDQCWTEGETSTKSCCETRVWERANLSWQCVHFHRS